MEVDSSLPWARKASSAGNSRIASSTSAEEHKAGISDPGHFAYPTYARAAAQRRDNLRQSAENLHTQLDDAKAELGEAFEELKKVEILDDRERSAERAQDDAREQAALNEIGLQRAIRASA